MATVVISQTQVRKKRPKRRKRPRRKKKPRRKPPTKLESVSASILTGKKSSSLPTEKLSLSVHLMA